MSSRSISCRLYEPDGTLLADGNSRAEDAPAPGKTIWVAVSDGDRMVHRYLLESIREVRLQFGDGPAVPAHVERVSISPRLGSICTLRIMDGHSPDGSADITAATDSRSATPR